LPEKKCLHRDFTRGEPEATGSVPRSGVKAEEVLRLAAIAEKGFKHPLARSDMAFTISSS